MSLTSQSDCLPDAQPAAPPDPVEAAHDLPLYALLEQLDAYDQMLEDPSFDPAKHIGEFDKTRDGIKRKVDATEKVQFELKAALKRNQERMDFWEAKRDAIENNLDRLNEYLKGQLESRGYDMIAGTDFILKLQRNSNPSLSDAPRDPTPEDAFSERLGTFVCDVPQHYIWRTDLIREVLKAEMNAPASSEAAPASPIGSLFVLRYGHHVKFAAADSPKVRRAKGAKK